MRSSPRDDTTLGRVVELRRTALGLKRKDLAERAGLSYPYISEIENGVKEPSAKALRKIADALELTVAELAALGERVRETPDSLAVVVDAMAAPAVESYLMPVHQEHASSGLPERSQLSLERGNRQSRLFVTDDELSEGGLDVLVRAEVARWLELHLPAIVRAEVETLLAERKSAP